MSRESAIPDLRAEKRRSPPGSSKEEAPPSFLVCVKVRFHRLHRPKVGSWTLLQFRKVSDSEATLSSIVRAMSKLVRNVPFCELMWLCYLLARSPGVGRSGQWGSRPHPHFVTQAPGMIGLGLLFAE